MQFNSGVVHIDRNYYFHSYTIVSIYESRKLVILGRLLFLNYYNYKNWFWWFGSEYATAGKIRQVLFIDISYYDFIMPLFTVRNLNEEKVNGYSVKYIASPQIVTVYPFFCKSSIWLQLFIMMTWFVSFHILMKMCKITFFI